MQSTTVILLGCIAAITIGVIVVGLSKANLFAKLGKFFEIKIEQPEPPSRKRGESRTRKPRKPLLKTDSEAAMNRQNIEVRHEAKTIED